MFPPPKNPEWHKPRPPVRSISDTYKVPVLIDCASPSHHQVHPRPSDNPQSSNNPPPLRPSRQEAGAQPPGCDRDPFPLCFCLPPSPTGSERDIEPSSPASFFLSQHKHQTNTHSYADPFFFCPNITTTTRINPE
ncbi:hypothetical protein LZ32DRAFT_45886 [Colletotrichum eremochloae]|nr:hypothetical protein LZ32DRAFT_45886 [Colletotrichum eremochloae]